MVVEFDEISASLTDQAGQDQDEGCTGAVKERWRALISPSGLESGREER